MHPIHERLIALNNEQSAKYIAEESARKRYWAKHPTFFACIKCMDGRVNLPIMTKTPLGIVKPFRAIGGKFEIWWPSFLGRLRTWVESATAHGSRCFIFVTYHFSESDSHLGCAGWHYDTKAARAHAEKLRNDISYVFGEEVVLVVAGVETDRDTLILHGSAGDLSGEMLVGKSEEDVRTEITKDLPELTSEMVNDLAPFMIGNAARVAELNKQPRHLDAKEHNERVIAVGQGFDWLTSENFALIINDADPNLTASVKVAASLIAKNLAKAPNDEATIYANVIYRQPGMDYRQAVARAKGLLHFAEQVVKEAYPELASSGRLHSIASVKWEPNKKIEVVEMSE